MDPIRALVIDAGTATGPQFGQHLAVALHGGLDFAGVRSGQDRRNDGVELEARKGLLFSHHNSSIGRAATPMLAGRVSGVEPGARSLPGGG